MKHFYNLLLFLVICFLIYVVFSQIHINNIFNKEAMTDMSGNVVATNMPQNGVAGNAAAYSASLKAATIKYQDTFLISKYRSDYESTILNLDDLINNLMLKSALSIDPNKPQETLEKLATMQQAKVALNSVMKYVDSQ